MKNNPNNCYSDDLQLAQAITQGSLEAWHTFLDQYAGLIYGIVRRYMFTDDVDAVRSVYVDVLAHLYKKELRTYRGESSLATWLIVFARNRAFDDVRKLHGRRREPAGIDKLGEFDRQVLQLYYVERFPLEIVVHVLTWQKKDVAAVDIVESMQRIEEVVDSRYFSRLDRERQAKRYDIDSQYMLDYLSHLRQEYDEKVHGNRPDAHMMDEETQAVVEKVREMVARLTTEEQRVVSLWFEKSLPASRIAKVLNLESQRRVYTIKNRVMNKLRKLLADEGIK